MGQVNNKDKYGGHRNVLLPLYFNWSQFPRVEVKSFDMQIEFGLLTHLLSWL